MDRPGLTPDHHDLIVSLNKHRVEYLIVGGWAVITYGYPRLTVDIDFFYRNSLENARRLYEALREFFGCAPPGIAGPEEMLSADTVQFGSPPNRIDFISRLDGVDFDTAAMGKESFPLMENCFLISLEALIRNKLATGRTRDLADVEELKKIRERRSAP